jgi:hypothetical protein
VTVVNEEGFDDERELCTDGNCLGVIVEGKCNVCGLAPGANAPEPGSPQAQMVAEGGHTDDFFDDAERQLCSDGACTGLLGPDGKCKVCGRTLSGSAAS